MKYIGRYLKSIIFLLILFAACHKDDYPEPEARILFSVDLDNQKFNRELYKDVYLAAYTSNGKLINYGNLSDSAKWELKGECKDDKIDILLFEIWQNNSMTIDHIKNVKIGQLFKDSNREENDPYLNQYLKITLKVEDFGNHNGNSTSLIVFEQMPRNFMRGSGYSGEFDWNKIEDGNAYKTSYIPFDPKYQGNELLIFERGTNQPYVYYLDIPAADLDDGDTIKLNKSDFKPGVLKSVQVNSNDNEFDNIFLYTYNSMDGKKDLITSFDQLIPNPSGVKIIRYINSDILPITYWEFKYFSSYPGSTSYTIRSNQEITSTIEINELTGHKITKSGDRFNFTHSDIFPGKNLARSTIQFSKNNCNNFFYSMYFDGSETIGNTTIMPFEILNEILTKYNDLLESNDYEWKICRYSHTYTNIPDNSPVGFLKNSLLNWNDNNSSDNDYSYEVFSINL